MGTYELIPSDGRKSFYGKAHVVVHDDGSEDLYSYGTLVMSNRGGKLHRRWGGWTATTGRHVKAFCGMSKSEYLALPVE